MLKHIGNALPPLLSLNIRLQQAARQVGTVGIIGPIKVNGVLVSFPHLLFLTVAL